MKVILLNGKTSTIETKESKFPLKSENACRSKIQFQTGQLLKEKFKFDPILEDVPTPEGFYFDFFLPKRKLVIEVQGKQHNQFSKFFHGSVEKFNQSKTRDNRKREFCRINDFTLIEIEKPEELYESL